MPSKEVRDYRINDEPFKAISKSGTWVKFKPLASGTHTGLHYFFKKEEPFDHVDIYESQKEAENKLIPSDYAVGSFIGTPQQRMDSVSGAVESFIAPLDKGITDIVVVRRSGSLGVRTTFRVMCCWSIFTSGRTRHRMHE